MMDLVQFGQRLEEPRICGERPILCALPPIFQSSQLVDYATQGTRSGVRVLDESCPISDGVSPFFGVAS